LERSLEELAGRIELPDTAWLADDVLRRVTARPARHVRRRVPLVAGLVAAAIVLIVIAVPGPRRAVARWLGFDSVRIEPGVTVPTTTTTATTATSVVSSGVASVEPNLDLGPAVSIGEAESQT